MTMNHRIAALGLVFMPSSLRSGGIAMPFRLRLTRMFMPPLPTDAAAVDRRRPARWLGLAGVLALAPLLASCVTVKPQERAILADPSMQFESDPQAAQVRHAIENREGSYGGAGVTGGGCGCN